MPKQEQQPTNEKGEPICGAKNKSTVNKRGKPRKNIYCHRRPMANGRCMRHGGKSTGAKNSIGYYRKKMLEGDSEALDLEDPMDLTGEIGMVRTLLTRMVDNPLRAYCADCRQWVIVDVECPNKEYNNQQRKEENKRPVDHHVTVKDNDYGDMVKATKLLSDIAKNHKEIQRGKEVHIKIEILNFVVNQIVLAYEDAEKLSDPTARRRVFIEGVERLLIDTAQGEIAERATTAAKR